MTTDPQPDWWIWPVTAHRVDAPIGRGQQRILAHLATNPDRTFSLGELAREIGIAAAQAYNQSRGLVNRRLVAVTTPVGPGRVRRIQVTAKGITIHQKLAAAGTISNAGVAAAAQRNKAVRQRRQQARSQPATTT